MSVSQAALAAGDPAPPDSGGSTDAGRAPPRNSTSLYVGDLQADVTEQQLSETFGTVGDLASVRICRDSVSGTSLGYAYVNFTSPIDAMSAMDTLNHTELNGRPIRIMWSYRNADLRKSGIGNLFVKNLPESIDSFRLQEIFSKFGKILSSKVVTSPDGKSRCYGYVQFETQESANAAVEELHEGLIEGNKISVSKFIKKSEREISNSRADYTNLYVKNLDQDIPEELLHLKFSEFGKITSLVIVTDTHGNSRGFGFINFESPASAKNAVETMNGMQLGSKELYVARAQKKAERQQILGTLRGGSSNNSAKNMVSNVYIKNIHDSVGDDDLRAHFSGCGRITSARVMRDEKGLSKGFGFVCFSSADEAKKAVSSLHGVMFHGKPLYVAIAQKKEERMNYLQIQHARRMSGHLPFNHPPHISQTLMYQQQQPCVPLTMNLNVSRHQWRGVGQRNGGMLSVGGIPCSYYIPNMRAGWASNLAKDSSSLQWSMKGDVATCAASKSLDVEFSFLASRPPEQQKQMLGDCLFLMIEKQKPDLAAKITGMLLEMENRELIRLLQSPHSLAAKVEEAEQILKNSKPKSG